MSGGQAIESAASKASDPTKFVFEPILTKRRDCQFSFGGISNRSFRYLDTEKIFNVADSTTIPDIYNFCAALQMTLVKHICLRTQRAMEFINNMNLISIENRTLVCLQLYSLISDFSIFCIFIVFNIGNIRRSGLQSFLGKGFRNCLLGKRI